MSFFANITPDTPVINLRNAILPQLLVNTTARDDFFHNILNTGNMDYRHVRLPYKS